MSVLLAAGAGAATGADGRRLRRRGLDRRRRHDRHGGRLRRRGDRHRGRLRRRGDRHGRRLGLGRRGRSGDRGRSRDALGLRRGASEHDEHAPRVAPRVHRHVGRDVQQQADLGRARRDLETIELRGGRRQERRVEPVRRRPGEPAPAREPEAESGVHDGDAGDVALPVHRHHPRGAGQDHPDRQPRVQGGQADRLHPGGGGSQHDRGQQVHDLRPPCRSGLGTARVFLAPSVFPDM